MGDDDRLDPHPRQLLDPLLDGAVQAAAGFPYDQRALEAGPVGHLSVVADDSDREGRAGGERRVRPSAGRGPGGQRPIGRRRAAAWRRRTPSPGRARLDGRAPARPVLQVERSPLPVKRAAVPDAPAHRPGCRLARWRRRRRSRAQCTGHPGWARRRRLRPCRTGSSRSSERVRGGRRWPRSWRRGARRRCGPARRSWPTPSTSSHENARYLTGHRVAAVARSHGVDGGRGRRREHRPRRGAVARLPRRPRSDGAGHRGTARRSSA